MIGQHVQHSKLDNFRHFLKSLKLAVILYFNISSFIRLFYISMPQLDWSPYVTQTVNPNAKWEIFIIIWLINQFQSQTNKSVNSRKFNLINFST